MLNIDWDKVDPKFNFVAMNSNAAVKLFFGRPELVERPKGTGFWYEQLFLEWGLRHSGHGKEILKEQVDWGVRYTPDGNLILKRSVDWRKTLTQRPVNQ